ncbi:MAG: YkgJ family cysteine cluster protein [Deltaproteobacteria bacterium]|nr:YkgJ family cysteine cluster protein [Deltaproteobacteria bacterium]
MDSDQSREVSHREPGFFTCFLDPDVKAFNKRMLELASEMGEEVEYQVDRFVESRRIPTTVFELMQAFRETYDRFVETVIAREGLNVYCKKGCSTCCIEMPTGVEPLEIMEIYDRIREWPDFPSIFSGAVDAVRSFNEIVRRFGHMEAGVLRRYAALRRPCVFLDRDGGFCRIYDIRPLICRAVFSLSPSFLCDPGHPDYDGPERKIEVIEPVDVINFKLLEINAEISKALGVGFPETLLHGLLFWRQCRGKGSPA